MVKKLNRELNREKIDVDSFAAYAIYCLAGRAAQHRFCHQRGIPVGEDVSTNEDGSTGDDDVFKYFRALSEKAASLAAFSRTLPGPPRKR